MAHESNAATRTSATPSWVFALIRNHCLLVLWLPIAIACGTPRAAVSPSTEVVTDELRGWMYGNPWSHSGLCREVGWHDRCDGVVADYSEKGIVARIEGLRAAQVRIREARARMSTEDAKLDQRLLELAIERELFSLVELRLWQTRPQFYDELFSVESYLTRDYDDLDTRVQALRQHIVAALPQTEHILKNLKGPLPEPFVRTDMGIYKGYAEYLRGDVAKILTGVRDPKLRGAVSVLTLKLADRAEAIAKHLETVELPRATQDFVLGKERYQKLLKVQEALDISLGDFEHMAEEDLAKNKKAYEELRATVTEARPAIPELLKEATRVTFEGKAYIEQKSLMTIPKEGRVEIRETPPFMRWNSAFLDGPGVFDKANLPAYYYITLPDPTWPKAEQEGYVMTHGTLLATSVHEVFPGHFLQGQWLRRAPTDVQKVIGSYSFVEGWAHYAEQLMIEEGFHADDPQAKLGQLSDALLRNCRFVVSIGLHTKGMTLAQAEERFAHDCHQDRATAKQQAVRGTFDPGYFAYTLGKLQILKLREEAKRALGSKFELRRFHDALLAHGAPQVPLLRERVLKEMVK